jgi:hypothetical protein
MKASLVSDYKSSIQAGKAAEPTVGDRDVLVEIHAGRRQHVDRKIPDWEFKLQGASVERGRTGRNWVTRYNHTWANQLGIYRVGGMVTRWSAHASR